MTVEQFEISPERIEQELRPVVWEQRKMDVFMENYNTDKGEYFYVPIATGRWRPSIYCRHKTSSPVTMMTATSCGQNLNVRSLV